VWRFMNHRLGYIGRFRQAADGIMYFNAPSIWINISRYSEGICHNVQALLCKLVIQVEPRLVGDRE